MEYKRKSLTERLYNLKKALYIPTAAALLSLASYSPLYPQATRTTETESFSNNTVSKSYIEEHPEKWDIANERLEAKDFSTAWGDSSEGSGYTRFYFNDRLYSFEKTNMETSITLNKSAWGSSVDQIGIIFAGDPIGGAFYRFAINAHPNATPQLWIYRQMPGFTHTYINSTLDSIIRGGTNTLTVLFNNTGTTYIDDRQRRITPKWNFFINGKKVQTTYIDSTPCDEEIARCIMNLDSIRDCQVVNEDQYDCILNCPILTRPCVITCDRDPKTGELLRDLNQIHCDIVSCNIDTSTCEIERDITAGLPSLEGYAGIMLWDSMGIRDQPFSSLTYADNFTVEYDNLEGAGGGLEDRLQPHMPGVFIRGDTNLDQTIDISDAIHTLIYLFLNRPINCPDSADANDDGTVNVSDAVSLLLYLFHGKKLPYPNIEEIGGRLIPDARGGMDLTYDNLPNCNGYPFDWSELNR